MIYLIQHLAFWLVLTAAFAGLAGWAFAALRAHPGESAALRERDRLMRDLLAFGAEPAGEDNGLAEREREVMMLRQRATVDAGRVAELERALEAARARAGEAAARVAELERMGARNGHDAAELTQLRERVAELEDERGRAIDIEPVMSAPAPSPNDEHVLQAWRLRYFEQRVRYLESQSARPVAVPAAEPEPAPDAEWRARTAEARVAFLEEEARRVAEAPEPPAALVDEHPADLTSPFASNAQTDMLMRWRMLYLEKRAAHLQERQSAEPEAELDAEEAERWKWRARYLEARVRHLESRPAITPAVAPEPQASEPLPVVAVEEEAAPEPPPRPAAPSVPTERPRPLGAPRDGAPDDFTLIEGVSPMQQRTLNSLGIYHFDQIAAWSAGNVAWVDQYLRLRGRIAEEEWVEQAATLARDGPNAARRLQIDEDA